MNIEQAIGEQMEEWGFSVNKIPESQVDGERRPDYKVICDGITYLIEVKSREDDKKEIGRKKRVLGQGEIYDQHKPLIRKSSESRIIKDACDQLENYESKDFYRIVWLCAVGDAQIAKFKQFKAALYGTTQLFDLQGDSYHRPCFFFRNSDFFRYRHILDAAIISTLDQVELCFNPFSTKITEFQISKFAETFKDSICDPIKDALNGDAYIVDSEVNRDDEKAVMKYLQKKYNAPMLQSIDMGYHSAMVSTEIK